MGLFMEVEGEVAILIEKGVYKQVPLYMRNGYLYAKSGGGFVRLNSDGSTTKPSCRLDTITYDQPMGIDPMGRLCDLAMTEGAKPIPKEKAQLLLGVES